MCVRSMVVHEELSSAVMHAMPIVHLSVSHMHAEAGLGQKERRPKQSTGREKAATHVTQAPLAPQRASVEKRRRKRHQRPARQPSRRPAGVQHCLHQSGLSVLLSAQTSVLVSAQL